MPTRGPPQIPPPLSAASPACTPTRTSGTTPSSPAPSRPARSRACRARHLPTGPVIAEPSRRNIPARFDLRCWSRWAGPRGNGVKGPSPSIDGGDGPLTPPAAPGRLREGGRGLVAGVHDLVQGRGVRELAPLGLPDEFPEPFVVGSAPGLGRFPDGHVRVPVPCVVRDRPVQAVCLVAGLGAHVVVDLLPQAAERLVPADRD